MKKSSIIKKAVLFIFVGAVSFVSPANAQGIFDQIKEKAKKVEKKVKEEPSSKTETQTTQTQKQIWGFAVLQVRVRNKQGKEFSRTYVSEIVPVTRADYNAFYNTDERFIKPRIWEYFAATVAAAAKERGEEIEEPYDGSIQYKFSLETTGNDVGVGEAYRFQPKSVLEEPRKREIDYAKQSNRAVFFFHWETSGKNVEDNLEKERNRKSAELPVKPEN